MKRISLNKVMAKLADQPEKIELAAADNLKYAKGVEIFGKNIDASIDLLEQGKRALEVDMENLRQDMRVMSKAMSEVETAAKELGINPNEVKGYKEAVDALQYGESQLNKAKKFL